MRRHRRIAALAAAAALAGAAEAPAATRVRTARPPPCRSRPPRLLSTPPASAASRSRRPRRRVDLVAPPFSNSHHRHATRCSRSASLRSAILNGRADGRRLKIETTLLPDTRVIEWRPGQCVRTLVSQFVAYRGGRILEVALDLYAQADDGSVWYLGEDVDDYEDGIVDATRAGGWPGGTALPA